MKTLSTQTINYNKKASFVRRIYYLALNMAIKPILLAVATACICLTVSAQSKFDYYLWPYNDNTQKIEFAESVYVPHVNGDSLFNFASRFLTGVFSTEKDTLVSLDTNTNVIVKKAALFIPVKELGARGEGYISFKFQVRCRNNQYSYIMTDFVHTASNPDGIAGGALEQDLAAAGGLKFPRKYWSDYKAKCYFVIQTAIERFKGAMLNKGEG